MTRYSWVLVFLLAPALTAQDLQSIILPKPDTTGGKPLMAALKSRKSSRSFSQKKIPGQILSNLLWAAFGINRPDGHRTAPSAMNWQEFEIYVVMEEGAYLYNPEGYALKPVLKGDVRGHTGTQDFVKSAPVNFVYVADLLKTQRASGSDRDLYVGADCGFIAQNVYLCCASEGLATVVRGSVNRDDLAKSLKLKPQQKIILAQTIGYPSE